jgi:hypothetical protein
LNYTYRLSDRLFNGQSGVANPNNISTTFHRVSLNGHYRFSNELRVSAFIPWLEGVRKERGTPDRRISGLGDITLLGQWSPWASEAEARPLLSGLSLIGGVELPTGEDDDQPFAGNAAPSLFQLGNGTINPKLGLSFGKAVDDWSFFGRVMATLPIGESDADLDPGSYLQTSIGTGYRLTESLTLQLSVDGTFRERDQLDGTDVHNTGSTTLSVSPALSWQVNERIALDASANIPFFHDVRSTQLAPGPSFQFGTRINF